MENPSKTGSASSLLIFLIVMFVGILMMSNILANHMIALGPFTIDAGTLTFPITYILSDVFSEVYGYKWSRRVAWYAMLMNALMAGFIWLAIILPQPEWYDGSHFKLGVGGSYRIVIASLISYQFGDFVNDRIFRHFKEKHNGMRGFAFRATLSSLGGQLVDTTLFVFIAFLFTMPSSQLFPMIIISVFLKWAYEITILPLTIKITKLVKKLEDREIKNGSIDNRG